MGGHPGGGKTLGLAEPQRGEEARAGCWPNYPDSCRQAGSPSRRRDARLPRGLAFALHQHLTSGAAASWPVLRRNHEPAFHLAGHAHSRFRGSLSRQHARRHPVCRRKGHHPLLERRLRAPLWPFGDRSRRTIARYYRSPGPAHAPLAGLRQYHAHGATRYAAGDLLAVPAVRKDGSRISIEFSIVPFCDAENPDAWHRGGDARRNQAF